jgi:transposase InsO family protein
MEQAVLEVRRVHCCWGGRKIRDALVLQGYRELPSPSTITAILHRHGQIDPRESAKRKELTRFERAAPNELWQMDFKGQFKLGDGQWCYPLTVLDDHSRYSLGVRACGDQRGPTVRGQLTEIFRCYGLPWQMLMDHGAPWCTAHSVGGWTALSLWLLRLDIGITRCRVCHPQTQGKVERFHRTLQEELKPGPWIRDLREAQSRFDPWRQSYNSERPHQALESQSPASRYRVSFRPYPEVLPEVTYGPDDLVRAVNPVGQFHLHGRVCKTSECLRRQRIGLRPTVWDGVFEVYFCRQRMGWLDLRGSRGKGPGVAVRSSRPEELRPPGSDAANDAADQPPHAEAG